MDHHLEEDPIIYNLGAHVGEPLDIENENNIRRSHSSFSGDPEPN